MDTHKNEKALLVIDSPQKALVLLCSKELSENQETCIQQLHGQETALQALYELSLDKRRINLALKEKEQGSLIIGWISTHQGQTSRSRPRTFGRTRYETEHTQGNSKNR